MRDGNNALSCQRIKYVEYLAKAETDLVARARFDKQPVFGVAAELPVTVETSMPASSPSCVAASRCGCRLRTGSTEKRG
jgi:hypothetical protein